MTAYYDLNKHVARLLTSEPFFAAFSRHLEKHASTAIPTAGVRINKEQARFEMIYNPEFFAKLTDEEVKIVLMHEFYHIIFEHITTRMPEEKFFKLWNFATDAAINSELFPEASKANKENIKTLYDMCILPEKFKLPRGKTADYYFEQFKDMAEKNKQSGKGQKSKGGSGGEGGDGDGDGIDGDQFDDHGGWSTDAADADGISEDIREVARARAREAMRQGAKESTARGWGNISAQMRKEIIERLQATIDWRKQLRYFVKTSQRADKMNSIKRINRRFPYIHAGRKTDRTSKIAICIDQSGSVSDKMLAAFYAELNALSQLAEFTIVPFDTQVCDEKVYVWKRGEKREFERVLCGGTCFNAPTKWVNERKFDGMMILTDMCAPKPISSKCQRLWVTDKANEKNPYFVTNERVIAVSN